MADLTGIQGVSPTLKDFVPVVRGYLRDIPELNRLLAGEETGDRFILWSVYDAISWFNGTPHLTALSIDDLFSSQQQSLLLRMTVVTIIESVGLLQTRNHINYSNGGINVGVNDKTPLLMNWLQYYRSSLDQRIQQVKVALNIAGILGPSNVGVHSELFAVNSTYLAY
jgi:hypothetical protein